MKTISFLPKPLLPALGVGVVLAYATYKGLVSMKMDKANYKPQNQYKLYAVTAIILGTSVGALLLGGMLGFTTAVAFAALGITASKIKKIELADPINDPHFEYHISDLCDHMIEKLRESPRENFSLPFSVSISDSETEIKKLYANFSKHEFEKTDDLKLLATLLTVTFEKFRKIPPQGENRSHLFGLIERMLAHCYKNCSTQIEPNQDNSSEYITLEREKKKIKDMLKSCPKLTYALASDEQRQAVDEIDQKLGELYKECQENRLSVKNFKIYQKLTKQRHDILANDLLIDIHLALEDL